MEALFKFFVFLDSYFAFAITFTTFAKFFYLLIITITTTIAKQAIIIVKKKELLSIIMAKAITVYFTMVIRIIILDFAFNYLINFVKKLIIVIIIKAINQSQKKIRFMY